MGFDAVCEKRDSEITRAGCECLGRECQLASLSFFLFIPTERLQAALCRGLGLLESVFLSPIHNRRRADPLNDPVKYPGIVARIEQNVCDVSAKSQSGIFRFCGLSGCRCHQGVSFACLHMLLGIGAAFGLIRE